MIDFHTVVESSQGHVFMSTDSENYESCLTCGGMWEIIDRGDGIGRYVANDGDPADCCSGDTSAAHGYAGEPICNECDGTGCGHCERDCNCLFCA